MVIAAIEIYNKPDFSCREFVFPILMVNAWESLAKARLLQTNNNRMQCLFITDKRTGRYRKSASGEYITISARDALKRCKPPDVVVENVGHLIDLRDDATHLPKQSNSHPMLIFKLGSASLKSYSILLKQWFGLGLSKYNFFILPLAFSYPFTTLTTLDLAREPETIARIIREVAANQERNLDDGGHHLICEIEAELVSAKKLVGEPDIKASIGQDESTAFVNKKSDLRSQYPYSWTEAFDEVKKRSPSVTKPKFTAFLKQHAVKGDRKYSAYSYPTLSHEKKGPTANTTVIYNMDLVRFCASFFD